MSEIELSERLRTNIFSNVCDKRGDVKVEHLKDITGGEYND